MTDLEIVKKCAEKEGRIVRPFTAKSAVCYDVTDSAIVASNSRGGDDIYDPLHDDAQAMELVKRFGLSIYQYDEAGWNVSHSHSGIVEMQSDLNRAICECVAKLPNDNKGD